MMMKLSEKLTERTSTKSGRLFVVLMVGLALAVALSMAFAEDAEAKKKKKKRKPPATYVPAPAELTVNTTADAGDRNIGDGKCDSLEQTGKQCTLRAAIEEADVATKARTIKFNIPTTDPNCDATTGVCTISPAEALQITTQLGVTIDGYSQPGSSPNTATTGTNAVLKIVLNGSQAEGRPGLYVTGSNTTIKGLVINGFQGTGVILFPDGGQPGGNRLEGSFIGTDATGTTAVANRIGVLASGFATGNDPSESVNEVVGGDTLAARNLISGNSSFGSADAGVDTFFGRATVEGNLIGTKKDGTTGLGNGDSGVRVTGSKNIIEGNTIAFNAVYGVEISPLDSTDTSTGNYIASNSIFENGLLGIDLGSLGPNANDFKDYDTGPNNLQNYPVIYSAKEVSPVLGTNIKFSLNSRPSGDFTVQFFSSPEADPSGFGEGKVFLGEQHVLTDGSGNAFDDPLTFSTAHPAASAGNFITATAINNDGGDTSEFSLAKEVDPPVAHQ